MPRPVVDSSSQGVLNIRRLSLQQRHQRRQNSSPVDHMVTPVWSVVEKLNGMEKAMLHPNISSDTAHRRNEQHGSFCVQEPSQLSAVGSKNVSPPAGASNSPDTASRIEGVAGLPMTKSRLSLANLGTRGESQIVLQWAHKLWRKAKISALQGLRVLFCYYKRRASRLEEPIKNLSMLSNEPPRLDGVQHGGKGGTQQMSANTIGSEIQKLQRENAELKQRLRDLETSDGFLSTTSKSLDFDIIQTFQRLNAEVQHITPYMVDYLTEDFEFMSTTTKLTKEQTTAVEKVSGQIGEALARSLGMLQEIPTLLQTAFQAYLASILCRTASSWVSEERPNIFINSIYQRLRRIETQAVSGRWRALARTYIIQNTPPESLIKTIIVGISDILLVAGCTALQSDIISKVTSKFEGKIAFLVELAGFLNKKFGEVISSDFEAFVIQPGKKFDDNIMEDMEDSQAVIQNAPVLCTTRVGLIKQTSAGTSWERGRKQKVIVMKAGVLLQSVLNTDH